MRAYFKWFLILFGIQFTFAQYTEVINSRRPGFSDSPYSVGTGVYQVEGGFFYKDIQHYLSYDFLNERDVISHEYDSKSYGSDIMIRTGLLLERLELNVDLAVRNESRNIDLTLNRWYIDSIGNEVHNTLDSSFTQSSFGLNHLTIGAKFMVYEAKYHDKSKEIRSWKARHSFDTRRLIPTIGVYAGLNTNIAVDALKKNNYLKGIVTEYNKKYEGIDSIEDMPKTVSDFGARFAIFTQNDLTDRWILLMNFIADQVFTDYMQSSFIMTTTYTFLDKRWSVFGEGQVFFRTEPGIPNDVQFGAGVAYLLGRNMQIDLTGRMILDERGYNTYLFNTGVSWRLDKHRDKLIKNVNENTEIGLPQEKRSFFDTITFGLFSKDTKPDYGKKPEKVKSVKAKKRDLKPPVNKKAQKAKKKRNKKLIKEQKRREKAQKKYYKKHPDATEF